jgi:hypothetical protein
MRIRSAKKMSVVTVTGTAGELDKLQRSNTLNMVRVGDGIAYVICATMSNDEAEEYVETLTGYVSVVE